MGVRIEIVGDGVASEARGMGGVGEGMRMRKMGCK